MKVRAQRGEGDLAETAEQQCFSFFESLAEGGVDRLFDQAARRLGAVADGQQFGPAEPFVDVSERDRAEIAGNGPAPAMALLGLHIASVSQARHEPSDHHGVGAHRAGQHVGGTWIGMFRHVQQDVKHAR